MVTRIVELTSQLQSSRGTEEHNEDVELLILGAGWTSTFLIPLLQSEKVTYAATTTTGRDNSIQFKFDPDSTDESAYEVLPQAQTVLITFPLTGKGQSKLLTNMYAKTHARKPRWIQLGSTGAFTGPLWNDYTSPLDVENPRVIAEAELLEVGQNVILHLAGLYGGTRDPKTWLPRIIKSKADIKGRKALHLVHGEDVARAVLGAHRHQGVEGSRWIVTDFHVYDWWDLIFEWGGAMVLEGESVKLQETVFECMREMDVRALPRGPETLGRVLDSTAFWGVIKSNPVVGRVR